MDADAKPLKALGLPTAWDAVEWDERGRKTSPRGEYVKDDIAKAIREDDAGLLATTVRQYGIDLNKPMANGATMLHEACLLESTHVVEWLIQHGADMGNMRDINMLITTIEARAPKETKKTKKMIAKEAQEKVEKLKAKIEGMPDGEEKGELRTKLLKLEKRAAKLKRQAETKGKTKPRSGLSAEDMRLFGTLYNFLEGRHSTAHQLFKEFDRDQSGEHA